MPLLDALIIIGTALILPLSPAIFGAVVSLTARIADTLD